MTNADSIRRSDTRSTCARRARRRGTVVLAAVAAACLGARSLSADETTCFPLRVYAPLAKKDPDLAQKDLAMAVKLQSGQGLTDGEIAERLDPDLVARLARFKGLVHDETISEFGAAHDLSVNSDFRPSAYQQHFYDLKKGFDKLAKLSRYVEVFFLSEADAAKGTRPQLRFLPGTPDAFQAKYGATMDCVNQGVAGHDLGLQSPTVFKLAVANPASSKHTTGQAADLEWRGTGLSQTVIEELAKQAGLYLPYKKSDHERIHFEVMPEAKFDGAYSGSYAGTARTQAGSAPVGGGVTFTIAGGVMTVTAPGGGTGSVSAKGATSFAGSGAGDGASYTFSGGFHVAADGTAGGGGGWHAVFPGGTASGTWSAAR